MSHAMDVSKDVSYQKKREQIIEIMFYLLVFAAITCFAMIQTFGDPPDEINRFKVVDFICRHGRLPHGADPEIILAGYGASYAFQPILTYIIQGYLLRFLTLFTKDGYILLLAARMVNVIFGVLMAYFIRQIAKEVWKNPYIQWVFTLLVVFLPQNIFIHSYVNTDSMAMLSIAIMFFVLLRSQRTNYSRKDCILLAVGIILCAMSYYNAYGIIVAAILIFIINFIHFDKKLTIEWRELLRKGSFISVIVLVGIAWWFIRNGILYQGDIIAMDARRECAIETATADYNPLTRSTYQSAGIPLKEMIFATGYLTLLRNSFIAMFGPMIIPTHGLIYIYYKRLWIVTCIAALLPIDFIKGIVAKKKMKEVQVERSAWEEDRKVSRKDKIAFDVGMVLFCMITIILSLVYSYTWEFQPQGRYILPILIPFMFLVTRGVQKICALLDMIPIKRKSISIGTMLGKMICVFIMLYVVMAFIYSLFLRFIPYYMEGVNMFSMYGSLLMGR